METTSLVPGLLYWACLGACLILLATLGVAIRLGSLSRELLSAGLTAAGLCVGLGLFVENRWQVEGVLAEAPRREGDSLRRTRLLLTDPHFLSALGVQPRFGPFLRSGLKVEQHGDNVRLIYNWWGLGDSEQFRTALDFAKRVKEVIEGVRFAAALSTARTTTDIARVLSKRPPVLLRPVRVLLRRIIPELTDRFPAARPLLAELLRRTGG